MSVASRVSAFLAYLLLFVGWILVWIFRRKDPFARFHTRQSMALVAGVLVPTAAWAVGGYLISLIPVAGPILASSLFALLLALYLFMLIVWLTGMVWALTGQTKALPLVGGWGARLPIG